MLAAKDEVVSQGPTMLKQKRKRRRKKKKLE
jgi:hypothetical protein